MLVRELAASELVRIGEIDRSETADGFYVVEDGRLQRVERRLEIPTWSEAELEETLERLARGLAAGGLMLGIVDGPRLAAAALLGGEPLDGERERLELVFLHVSRPHRRHGLAGALFDEVCVRARQRGAEQLYISSSDVEPAVRFYLARDCRLAERVDRAIASRWPADIPLELDL